MFIEKAKMMHNDLYDYSQVQYINASTKVIIICKMHGTFSQLPGNHLKGQNCPICGAETRKKSKCQSKDVFLSQAHALYVNKYDYSKAIYANKATFVVITCKEQGDFGMVIPIDTNPNLLIQFVIAQWVNYTQRQLNEKLR